MQVNMVITAKTAGNNKKVTTTISYIRPTATDSSLSQFAQALNALTTNTYVKANKETESVL